MEIVSGITLQKFSLNNLSVTGITRIVEILFIIFVVVKCGDGLSETGLDPADLINGFKKGLVWSVCFGLVTSVTAAIIFFAGINPLTLLKISLPKKPGDLMVFLLIAGIVGPIAEELFFRGIVFGFFRRWGFFAALALSTLFFVFLHSSQGVPVTQIVGGTLFAIAYEIEGSLITPITIHILGNMALFALS